MSYTVERIGQEPIIFIRMLAPLNLSQDLPALYHETDALTADISGTIYRIMDWTQAELTFDLVMEGLDIQRKNNAKTAPRSPRVKNHYVVNDHWGTFMIDAIKQAQYGGVQAPAFSNAEEALAYVRQLA